jgi:alginate O-acetyltransferase complex protein AlgI
MVFSSLVFLYVFLPIVIVGYYIIPHKFKNSFLFVSSILFFAWGGVSYTFILLFSLLFNYFIGRGIAFSEKKKLLLAIGVTVNLLIIGVFKYAGLIIESSNFLSGLFGVSPIQIPKIVLPIGISFYTFQAISYLVDIYRRDAEVQKKFINVGLYISLFPQLIAGPIVRYHDISLQLKNRSHNFEKFSSGVIRFVLGLGKKVLIANNIAIIADYVFELQGGQLSFASAWIGLLAYSFQIYFDFSGYSDMAIGLGRMFGFEILENFNFPYIAKSVREFWRRWHISLSNWFRDYLYISLGGSHAGKMRTYINLFFVFFITGLWHGASWNFVVWGLVHGFIMVIERLGFERVLKKLPGFITNSYTFLYVILAWVLFRAEDFDHAAIYYKALFSFNSFNINDLQLQMYLNNETYIVMVFAVFGAFGGFILLKQGIQWMIGRLKVSKNVVSTGWLLGEFLFIIMVLFLSTLYLVNNSYNPFIYFRF